MGMKLPRSLKQLYYLRLKKLNRPPNRKNNPHAKIWSSSSPRLPSRMSTRRKLTWTLTTFVRSHLPKLKKNQSVGGNDPPAAREKPEDADTGIHVHASGATETADADHGLVNVIATEMIEESAGGRDLGIVNLQKSEKSTLVGSQKYSILGCLCTFPPTKLKVWFMFPKFD